MTKEKTGVDILRPDKLEFRAKKITGERRKEGHHTMIEGPMLKLKLQYFGHMM